MEASTCEPARQKSFSRRVSFNEDTILPPRERRRDYRDLESRLAVNRRRRCRIGDTHCFWISVVLGLLLFLLLFGGGLYYGFLKSHMPEVRIQRLDVAAAAAAPDLTVFLNATNAGDRTVLIYHGMAASVAVGGARSGVVRLADVWQPPANSTLLEVAAAGDLMRSEAEAEAEPEAGPLVVDVRVRGRIALIVGGRKMHGFPFKIDCRKINQSEIDAGRAPPCSTELSPLSCLFGGDTFKHPHPHLYL